MARVAATHRPDPPIRKGGTDATHGFPGHGVPPIIDTGPDVVLDITALKRASSIVPKPPRFSGGFQGRIPRIARRLR